MTATPTVHLNGTSKQELMDGYIAVKMALRDARNAIYKAAPNGRDYYVQGKAAYSRAHDEHAERLRKLQDICQEIDEILMAVNDQGR